MFDPQHALSARGPFFQRDSKRVNMRWVCYGPFPSRSDTRKFPEELQIEHDFEHIRKLGFNGVRLYETPPQDLLKCAERAGLSIAAGPAWDWSTSFLSETNNWKETMRRFWKKEALVLEHEAIELIYVANEIPADLVRFMNPEKVGSALDWLIGMVRSLLPGKLIGYANYPSTEYLELEEADFTAFNVYLEDTEAFASYLRRLQLHSPDRPLILSEIGADSLSLGEDKQAELVSSLWRIAENASIAGLTAYAYSDNWWNHQRVMSEWAFGLVTAAGDEKPIANAISEVIKSPPPAINDDFSLAVIICTKNGARRLQRTIASLQNQTHPADEIIVVDDGSDYENATLLAVGKGYHLLTQNPAGLSAARNLGACHSECDWIAYTDDDCQPDENWIKSLKIAISQSSAKALGGPNLPPPPECTVEAINAAAPGGASHVMLNDHDAEHLPGCNLAVERETLIGLGGFDERFRVAGDDVDLCWRLIDQGHSLAYCPNAVVWHSPRPTALGYFKQQWGYGKAERLLREKHPSRFDPTGAPKWDGVIYEASNSSRYRTSTIYHGPMGTAPYQMANLTSLPRRQVSAKYRSKLTDAWLSILQRLQPVIRQAARESWCAALTLREAAQLPQEQVEFFHSFKISLDPTETRLEYLNKLKGQAWQVSRDEQFDLTRGSDHVITAEEQFDDGSRRLLVKSTDPTIPRSLA